MGGFLVTGSSWANTFGTPAGITTSVVNGILNVDSGLGGNTRVAPRWTRPTTNVGGSPLHDLKTYKLYVGTTAGGTQIINGLDFSTTAQRFPSECRITGLPLGTYTVRVKAVDSAGNESTDSGELSTGSYIYSAPSRSFSNISSTTPINSAGDYQLSASFSGQITINVSNVYLYGNGFTLTHNSGHGIVIAAGVSNVWIDGVIFNRTSGTGSCVRFNGTPGTGCIISRCTMTVVNGTAGINGPSDPTNLNGTRIFGNTCTVQSISSLSEYQAFVSGCNNFISYNNVGVNNATGHRSGMYGNCGSCELWSDTWSCTGSTLQAFYFSAFARQTAVIHDSSLTVGGTASTVRVVNFDGDDANFGPTAESMVPKILWCNFAYAVGANASGPMVRIRNMIGPCDGGYNTFNMLDGGGNAAFLIGDSDSGFPADAIGECPWGFYIYNNTALNYGSSDPFQFYGGLAWNDWGYTWNNNLGGQGGGGGGDPSGSGGSGNWHSDGDTWPNGVNKVTGSASWERTAATSVTGTNPFTLVGSPRWSSGSDTPSAPGTPVAVNPNIE